MKNLFLVTLLIAGCSFKKKPLSNQTQRGHQQLYSEPDAPKAFESKTIKRVVIAATSDIEARYRPQVLNFEDEHNSETQTILVGGMDAMSSYFKVLRDEYQNVLLVDSGNIFSTKASLKEVRHFYENNKYDAVTVGLNDFNIKLPQGITSSSQLFREFAKESNVPLVLSNLYEVKTARGVEWKGTAPYLIKDIGGVKIGIIGLIPSDVVSLTPTDNRVGLIVENMVTNTLRHARLLRSLGADLIVALTHQGLRCGQELSKESKLPIEKVNFEPRRPEACDLTGPLGSYLARLPPGLVDIVVGGRIQGKMANFVNDTLVLGALGQGKSMIFAEFFVDSNSKKVLVENTVVHQPVMFCRQFFKETGDCYSEDPSVDHKERIPAKFLGKDLLLSATTDNVSIYNDNQSFNIKHALGELNADIAYIPTSSGNTQLVLFRLKGVELVRLLEEDYNNGSQHNWFPSPFSENNEELKVKIRESSIDPIKTYSILTDLEGVQSNRKLSMAIVAGNGRSMANFSWTSFHSADLAH